MQDLYVSSKCRARKKKKENLSGCKHKLPWAGRRSDLSVTVPPFGPCSPELSSWPWVSWNLCFLVWVTAFRTGVCNHWMARTPSGRVSVSCPPLWLRINCPRCVPFYGYYAKARIQWWGQSCCHMRFWASALCLCLVLVIKELGSFQCRDRLLLPLPAGRPFVCSFWQECKQLLTACKQNSPPLAYRENTTWVGGETWG